MIVRSSLSLAFAATMLGLALWPANHTTTAQESPSALAGEVRSAREGRMEGVLVTAKRTGSAMSTTVVSGGDGIYSFSQGRLQPGRYEITIRATGYVMPPTNLDVPAGASARLDLDLRPANVLELALQLTDPEWLASYPLDDETKFTVFRDCSRCHSLQRPSFSRYNADQLAWVMKRMVYSAGSSPMTFQLPVSRVMLERAASRAAAAGAVVHLQIGDAQALAFRDAQFDTVVCTLGLCRIPDERRTLAEAWRVLRPGGRLLLLEHVRSTYPLVHGAQRLLDPIAGLLASDHLLRDPLPLAVDTGFEIVRLDRLALNTIQRLSARKPLPT